MRAVDCSCERRLLMQAYSGFHTCKCMIFISTHYLTLSIEKGGKFRKYLIIKATSRKGLKSQPIKKTTCITLHPCTSRYMPVSLRKTKKNVLSETGKVARVRHGKPQPGGSRGTCRGSLISVAMRSRRPMEP